MGTYTIDPSISADMDPAMRRKIQQKILARMDRDLEMALYGGYAPANVNDDSVVSVQTPSRKRIETI